ncbi:MAG: NAD(P)H-hydrate dehydratase [Muribaculaceae bacterium]
MKIFTTKEIRTIDNYTIEHEGIKSIELMDQAAEAVTCEVMSRFKPNKRIVVFAGSGNNGGDALLVALKLYEQGYHPEVILFNVRSKQLSENCELCRDRLLAFGNINFTEVVGTFIPPEISKNDVVIDGLFGTGLRTPVNTGFAMLIGFINDSGAYVISIDVPSGLCGEYNSGTPRNNIVRANLTLTFQFPRLAYFFAENANFIGEVKILDINLSQDAIASTRSDYYLIEDDDIRAMIKPRNVFCNKYDAGTVFLAAGSYGMVGASIMAARAVLRSGAGLVTVHAPSCAFQPLQTAVPEALFEVDRGEFFSTQIDLKRHYSAVALGPGLGTDKATIDALDQFLKSCHTPVVLDADALNCIALRPIMLRSIPSGSVLTPHSIEFDRLFGAHGTQEERLLKAKEVSKLYGFTIVLKGHYTMTVRSNGEVYINSSGNAGMATAGSGDVLTGIIASLIAQGYARDLAVVMAVYIHGLAGDLAAEQFGEMGITASDIINNIGRAIRSLSKPRNNGSFLPQ